MPELTIAGPNLTSGNDFHVHKAGCSDLKRRVVYRGAPLDTGEFVSVQDVVESIYSDMIDQGDEGTTWRDYQGSIDFFPCCGKLEIENPLVTAEQPEIEGNSLQEDQPDATVVTSSKAAPAKRTAKEATVSTKTETKSTKRSWNKTTAKQVISRRDRKGLSWREIGLELGFSPRTVRSMYDNVKGPGAHYDSRLPGKGGRFRLETVAEAAERRAANGQDN